MGIDSVVQSHLYTSPDMVSAQPPPSRPRLQSADSMQAEALSKMQPASTSVGDHANLVDKLLADVDNSTIRTSLDEETLKCNLVDANGKRKVGWRAGKELRSLRLTAERTLAKLDGFTGRELAEAIGKDHAGSKADQAVQDAIKAQFDLAAGLRASAAKAGGDTQLNALAHEAEMRGCEIARLADELYQLAQAGKTGTKDLSPLENKNLVSTTAVRLATTATSTRQGLELLRSQLKLFIDVVSSQLNRPSLDDSSILMAHMNLTAIKAQLEKARANGGVKTGAQDVQVQVDDRVLAALESKVGDMEQRLAKFGQVLARSAATKYVNELVLPDLPAELKQSVKDETDELKKRLDQYEMVRGHIFDYIEGRQSKEEVLEKLPVRNMRHWFNNTANGIEERVKSAKIDTPAVRRLIAQMRTLADNRDSVKYDVVGYAYDHVFEHLEQILNRSAEVTSGAVPVPGEDLRSVIWDSKGISRIAELRLHGYEPQDLDPALVTAEKVTVSGGGKGGVNSVSLIDYTDSRGNTVSRVFKPERAARLGVNAAQARDAFNPVDGGWQATNTNLASHDVAELMGCGELIAKTYVSVHEGMVGMSMERAPGYATRDVVEELDHGKSNPLFDALSQMGAEDLLKVKGQLAKQLIRLQWLDLVNGQLDRHDGNWLLDIAPGTMQVTVTGIDNDLSFPDKVVGLNKFLLNDWEFTLAAKGLAVLVAPDGEKTMDEEAAKADLLKRGGVSQRPDGMHVIDLKQADFPTRFSVLTHVVGNNGIWAGKTMSPPDVMDVSTFFHIVGLTKDSDCAGFRQTLAKRHLSPDQIEAAVARLKDVRAMADKLWQDGRVLLDSDWFKPELIAELSKPSQPEGVDELIKKCGFLPLVGYRIGQDYHNYFSRGDGGLQTVLERVAALSGTLV